MKTIKLIRIFCLIKLVKMCFVWKGHFLYILGLLIDCYIYDTLDNTPVGFIKVEVFSQPPIGQRLN